MAPGGTGDGRGRSAPGGQPPLPTVRREVQRVTELPDPAEFDEAIRLAREIGDLEEVAVLTRLRAERERRGAREQRRIEAEREIAALSTSDRECLVAAWQRYSRPAATPDAERDLLHLLQELAPSDAQRRALLRDGVLALVVERLAARLVPDPAREAAFTLWDRGVAAIHADDGDGPRRRGRHPLGFVASWMRDELGVQALPKLVAAARSVLNTIQPPALSPAGEPPGLLLPKRGGRRKGAVSWYWARQWNDVDAPACDLWRLTRLRARDRQRDERRRERGRSKHSVRRDDQSRSDAVATALVDLAEDQSGAEQLEALIQTAGLSPLERAAIEGKRAARSYAALSRDRGVAASTVRNAGLRARRKLRSAARVDALRSP